MAHLAPWAPRWRPGTCRRSRGWPRTRRRARAGCRGRGSWALRVIGWRAGWHHQAMLAWALAVSSAWRCGRCGLDLWSVPPPTPTEGSIGMNPAALLQRPIRQITGQPMRKLKTAPRRSSARPARGTSALPPLLMVDIDGVISLFGAPTRPGSPRGRSGARPPRPSRAPSTRSTAYPTSSRPRAAAHLLEPGRALRPGVGERLGGEGRGAPAPPARPARGAAVPALRALARARQRALEARGDRRLRRRARWPGSTTRSTTPATTGRGARGPHAARPDRPRARAHVAGGGAACGRGRGSARRSDRTRAGGQACSGSETAAP